MKQFKTFSVLLAFFGLSISSALAQTLIAEGKCGAEKDGSNLTWTLTSDNVLTINGSGAMADYNYNSFSPWDSYRTQIKTLIIGNLVKTIGNYAFYSCSGLDSVTIPNSLTTIGYGAFSGCSGLTSVTIPSSVKTIKGAAFFTCSGLTSVIIPSSVTSIGEIAFYSCSGLTSVTIPSLVTEIGQRAFQYCSRLQTVNYNAKNCTTMGSFSYPAFANCSALTALNIGNNVTNIPANAFSHCSSLTSVTIPSSVTTIGSAAFSYCSRLQTVNYNATNCTKTGSSYDPVFDNCSALTTLNIGNNVTNIPASVFSGCSSLRELTTPFIGTEPNATGANATLGVLFGTTSNDAMIGVTQYYNATQSSTYYLPLSLEKITISDSTTVTQIGYGALYGCTMLKEVSFPSNIIGFGEKALYNCNNLEHIYAFRPNPPSAFTNATFSGVNKFDCILHVPSGSEGKYAHSSAAGWNEFFNIQGNINKNPVISGKVTHNGNPLAGVSIAYGDSVTTTNAAGEYSITVNYNTAVTLTPTLENYTFEPVSLSFPNVTGDIPNQNFAATLTVEPSIGISGMIRRQDQTSLSSGVVSLYKVETMSRYNLIDTVPVTDTGSYTFHNVETGSYLIRVTSALSENALPSYYGNTAVWTDARIVTVAGVSLQNMDITIIPQTGIEGGSTISGHVGEDGEGKKSISKSTDHPVPDIDVYLQRYENKWTTIAHTLSNAESYFEFRNLPAGKYMVILDIPGLGMINMVTIDLDGENSAEEIEFEITENGIITIKGGSSITTLDSEHNIHIYPNPTTGELHVTGAKANQRDEIGIYDVYGRVVMVLHTVETGRAPSLQPDDAPNTTTLDISHLPAGVYFLRVGNETVKVVKQ